MIKIAKDTAAAIGLSVDKVEEDDATVNAICDEAKITVKRDGTIRIRFETPRPVKSGYRKRNHACAAGRMQRTCRDAIPSFKCMGRLCGSITFRWWKRNI